MCQCNCYWFLNNAMLKKRLVKIILGILLGLLFMYTFFASRDERATTLYGLTDVLFQYKHDEIIEKYYERRQKWPTSVLGTRLFKYNDITLSGKVVPQNRTYTVLIWRYWNWLKKRHLLQYGSGNDPFKGCSVNNCIFTGDDNKLSTADAVVVHLLRGAIPNSQNRTQNQRWIFLNDESPQHVFSLSKRPLPLKSLAGVFNWSMTFRSDSDVPVPYGRTVARETPLYKHLKKNDIRNIIPNWKKKRRDVIATVLMSNCGVKPRMEFLAELQKHIQVDIYGGCSNNETLAHSCPGHFKSDCEPISTYLFYLALENSDCHEYLTEKIWHHGFGKGSIPVIMGPSLTDCQNLLPPNSFIHIPMSSNAETIKKLATTMLKISEQDDNILFFHRWRNHFKAVNEHGYFGTRSRHLCHVCEALNYNSPEEKIYDENDIKLFLDPNLTCE